MSDNFRIRPILNTEYDFKIPVAVQLLNRFKYVIAILIVIVALSVSYDKEIAAWFGRVGDNLETWLKNPNNDWIYLILLVLLLQIYRKYPTFFAPATVVSVLGLMVLLCFQYNNFNADHVLNKWLIVAVFVFPILPLIAVMVKTNTGWMHWAAMAIYVVMVAIVMIFNPNEFLGKYDQDISTVYIVALIGFFSMISVYLNKNFAKEAWPLYITKLGFVLLCLLTAGFSLQYAIRFFLQQPEFSMNYLLMLGIIIGFVVMFGVIMVMRLPKPNLAGMASRLWLAVLYCNFKDFLDGHNRLPFYILLVEIALIVWYALSVKLFTKIEEGSNGKQLVNEPVSLRKEKNINVPFNFHANYAVSFWLYLVPQSKEFNANSSTFVNVLDYGGKPSVMYNSATNTLRVSVRLPKKTTETTEVQKLHAKEAAYDAAITAGGSEEEAQAAATRAYEAADDNVGENVLMADIPKVPLQRWHHIVLAYNNGTFDIFLNGVLFRSVKGVMTDTAASSVLLGASGGNRGKLCNLVFYQNKIDPTNTFTKKAQAITADKVTKLYNTFAKKNPPIVSRVLSMGPNPSYLQLMV